MDQQPEAKQTADSDSTQSPTARPVQFRLVHIVYVLTLLCTAIATFGLIGCLWATGGVVFWGYVFRSPSRPAALATAIIVAIMVICLGGLCLPAGNSFRDVRRRTPCISNLKQITLALRNYDARYKSFPPAFFPDKNGEPMHSWRVLILPDLGYTALYDQYDFDEPWDGPNNRQLAASRPGVFACPSTSRLPQYRNGSTGYVAVVGPETAWPGTKGRKESEITDGTSSTILVLEAPEFAINWMEPRDPSLEDAIRVLSSPDAATVRLHDPETLLFTYYSSGRNVAFADGRVEFWPHGVAGETWRPMFTVDGSDGWSDWGPYTGPFRRVRQPKVGKFISLVAFLLMLALPLPWVWLNPASATQ